MSYFERYDKKVMESFALRVLTKSFDAEFGEYFSPDNTNNFDFLSKDGKSALEVTTIIPQNVMEAYKYEKEYHKGKRNLSTKRIKNVKTRDDGSLRSYYGGDMREIACKILETINIKHHKAIKRIKNLNVNSVDLCICMDDGGLFDLNSFEIAFEGFEDYIFENIFFITSSYFVRYNKIHNFQEYERKI